MVSEPALVDIAAAILDGDAVDWAALESADLAERALFPHLRMLATIAKVFQGGSTGAADAPEFQQTIPERWGHLELRALIGRGAFGDVYRARDTRLDRDVALKLLPVDAESGENDAAVLEEGRLLGRVRHPNVVTIYGADLIDGYVGLWMELVEGETLQHAVARGVRFSGQETAWIGLELARALSAVHRAGLVHRDVKAHNVMRTNDGRLMLMDFGTGRDLREVSQPPLAGTPLYLAPELLDRGAPSAATDVYSVGVLMFYLLTGEYPVSASDLQSLRDAHRHGRVRGSRDIRSDVPRALDRIIAHALQSNPADRYQSAAALEADLQRFLRPALVPARKGIAAAAVLGAASVLLWSFHERLTPLLRALRVETSSASAVAPPAQARVSIAVLPLENVGADPNDADLADGLSDEILRNLAIIKGLDVRSRTSSFTYRDQRRDIRAIAQQLNVAMIVEGSVIRRGNRVRVNAQLVRAADDVPIWSDKFEGEIDDVIDIQDEISRAIVNRLRLSIGAGQRKYDVDPLAYQEYLKARAIVGRRGADAAQDAIRLLERVIARDRAYAPAHAGLAAAYAAASMDIQGDVRANGLAGVSTEKALARIRSSAETALRLDPLLAEAHAALGILHARELHWQEASVDFSRALEIDPSLSDVRVNFALSVLLPSTRFDEAETVLNEAERLDPMSLDVRRTRALVNLSRGRYDEAIDDLKRIEAIDASLPYVDLFLARALTFAGRMEEALPRWEARSHQPGWQHWMALAYVRAGRRDEIVRLAQTHEHPFRQAIFFAALGERARALAALDRAADLVPQRVTLLSVAPEMAMLKDDPAFTAIRRKLRLP